MSKKPQKKAARPPAKPGGPDACKNGHLIPGGRSKCLGKGCPQGIGAAPKK